MPHTGETKSFTNQGFRIHDNTISTYQQTKGGLSYLYCKRQVMSDGIHTKPLNIALSPWPHRELEVVDKNHPWSLVKEHEFCIEGNCSTATSRAQMKYHLFSSKYTEETEYWKHDTYWTTGLSPPSSLLRFNTPGQNKLGEKIEQSMCTCLMRQDHLMDHDYL